MFLLLAQIADSAPVQNLHESGAGYDLWMIATIALLAIVLFAGVIIVTLLTSLIFIQRRAYLQRKDIRELRVALRRLREEKFDLEDQLKQTQESEAEALLRVKRMERAKAQESKD